MLPVLQRLGHAYGFYFQFSFHLSMCVVSIFREMSGTTSI